MLRSLYSKLALGFVLVAMVTAGLVALTIRLTSADRLSQLILDQQTGDLSSALVNYYTANKTWDRVAYAWHEIENQAGPQSNGQSPNQTAGTQANLPQNLNFYDHKFSGEKDDRRQAFGLADAKGVVVVSNDNNLPVGTQTPDDILKKGTVIVVNNQAVGTLLPPRQPLIFTSQESLFLERTNQALIMAMLGAMLVALIAGIVLARTLTNPLKALTGAAHRIADGQLEQQVQVRSRDEIGELATAFNRMSQEVALANQQRRQMTADIAHDLRTPLTVIAGYVESMQDGVLKPTPERLGLIYSEIERLQKMVGDLRLLSQADAGELPLMPERVQPRALLEHAAELFAHPANLQSVDLQLDAPANLPCILVDESRMMQVLDNLIANALRYTPEGGKITLAAQAGKDKVLLSVSDTGAGIPPEELTRIFNRFYRVDRSRHSDIKESGLGLAIVKALVEAHGGRVWAESTLGEGTQMCMEFDALSA